MNETFWTSLKAPRSRPCAVFGRMPSSEALLFPSLPSCCPEHPSKKPKTPSGNSSAARAHPLPWALSILAISLEACGNGNSAEEGGRWFYPLSRGRWGRQPPGEAAPSQAELGAAPRQRRARRALPARITGKLNICLHSPRRGIRC